MTKNDSYQEMNQELETIVEELQSDDVDVDTALKLYERGQKVIEALEARLADAENKISELKPRRIQ